MGVDSTFVYVLGYDLYSGEDIKYIELAVPGFSTLNYVYCTDTGDTLTFENNKLLETQLAQEADTLYVAFADSITDSGGTDPDSLYISFNTKLLKNAHNFTALVYNSALNDSSGGIKIWENKGLGSWTVITTSIMKIISNTKAVPKVFTPNNDNVNDFTVIEFTLATIIEEAKIKIKIKIYDTKGSLVTTIFDDVKGSGDYFVHNKSESGAISLAKTKPGYWDGKDEDGDLVPPGVYLFQVIADTDDGEKIKSGTVVVAY